MERLVDFAWLFGIGGLFIAGFIFLYISRQPDGNDKMRDIAKRYMKGAMAYLEAAIYNISDLHYYNVLCPSVWSWNQTAIAFVGGAISSMLAAFWDASCNTCKCQNS